ncbi:hypothetical protein FRB94_005988 [Tulasnella sp. JGI-2019a]|nr:hypothetical protein FRB94_005988 [Tulasnella sp. JGI-2019a]
MSSSRRARRLSSPHDLAPAPNTMQPWCTEDRPSPSRRSTSRPRSMQAEQVEPSRQWRSSLKPSNQSPVSYDAFENGWYPNDRGPLTPPMPSTSSMARPGTSSNLSRSRQQVISPSAVASNDRRVAMSKQSTAPTMATPRASPMGRSSTKSTRVRSRSRPRIGRHQVEVSDSSSESDREGPPTSLRSPGRFVTGKPGNTATRDYQNAPPNRSNASDSPRRTFNHVPDLPITNIRSPMSIPEHVDPYRQSQRSKLQSRAPNNEARSEDVEPVPQGTSQLSPQSPRPRGPLRVVNSDNTNDIRMESVERTPKNNNKSTREEVQPRAAESKRNKAGITPTRPPLDPSFFRDIRVQPSPSPSLNAPSSTPSPAFVSPSVGRLIPAEAIGQGTPTPRVPTGRSNAEPRQRRSEPASEPQEQDRGCQYDRPLPQAQVSYTFSSRREGASSSSSSGRFIPHPSPNESKAPPALRSPLEPSTSAFPENKGVTGSLRQEGQSFQGMVLRPRGAIHGLVDGLGLGGVVPPSPDEVLDARPRNSKGKYPKGHLVRPEQAKQRVSLVSERSMCSEDDDHDTTRRPSTHSSSNMHGQGRYETKTLRKPTGPRYEHDDRSQHEAGTPIPALSHRTAPLSDEGPPDTTAGRHVREANKALFLALEQSPGAFSVTSAATSRDDGDVWNCSPNYSRRPSSSASVDATPLTSRTDDRYTTYEKSPEIYGGDDLDCQDSLLRPQPTITIQPSTSVSSGDGLLRRSRSNDSISSYSDMNDRIDDDGQQDQRWSHHSTHTEELSDAARTLLEAVKNWPEKEAARDRDASESYNQRTRKDSAQAEDTQSFQGGAWSLHQVGSGVPSPSPDAHFSGHDQSSFADRVAGSSKTWRSTLPPDAYNSLSDKYGALEMRRQEVIWELCNTEQDFVQSLRMTMRVFVQPLRTDSRDWVQGIPKDVTKLFEWLEDIVELHSRISLALLDVRSAQYPVVLQVAEYLRGFVPHLDVHQPYLVTLEGVSQTIEEALRDSHSDLGEFLRIQSTSAECASMPLTSFLLKPVQRLMKYPLFLKQLWELTPRNHPDHLATFSLLHSTETVIKVMQEVKAREEEYDLIKSLANRIKGLPPGFQLAHRDRRLVAQGLLRRMNPSDKEQTALNSTAPTSGDTTDQFSSLGSQAMSPLTFSAPHITPDLAKLMPITAPRSLHQFSPGDQTYNHVSPARPESTASDLTNSSDDSQSVASSHLHMSPSTTIYSLRNDTGSRRSFETEFPGEKFVGNHDQTRSRSRGSSIRGSLRLKREIQVYAFVFTDFVLLTAPVSERYTLSSPKGAAQRGCWKVLDDVGLCRVLGVTNHSGKLNYEHLLGLDLLPMNPGRDVDLSANICATPVFLSLPERMASKMALGPPHALQEARMKWLEAFEQCVQYTFRSLCLPTRRQYPDLASSLDAAINSQYSVMSVLASGDLLPRTSCVPDLEAEAMTGLSGDESRWWMAKFQRVVREMEIDHGKSIHQLLTLAPSTTVQPRRQRTAELKSNTSHSGPRPLLLASAPTLVPEERKGLLRSFSRKARS